MSLEQHIEDARKEGQYLIAYLNKTEAVMLAAERSAKAILDAGSWLRQRISDVRAESFFGSEGSALEIWADLMGYEDTTAKELMNIYNATAAAIEMPGLFLKEAAEEDKYERIGKSVYGIEARFAEGRIYVRLPLLRRRPMTGQDNSVFFGDYTNTFAADVRRAVMPVVEQLGPELALFRTKTLSYFFVQSGSLTQAPDADNRDTKCVTDAITSLLPGGDAASGCDFSFCTVQSGILEQGTYVMVSQGRAAYQPLTAVEDIARIFNQCG